MMHKKPPAGYYFTDMFEIMFFKSIFVDEDDERDLKRYHLINVEDANCKTKQIRKRFESE